MRLALDKQASTPASCSSRLGGPAGDELAHALLEADQIDRGRDRRAARARGGAARQRLATIDSPRRPGSRGVADALVKKSVWIVGGDGWAYDIGYGGLDHVLASGANVNVLVLDTEVYSNTGGQMSKATPRGAVAKFAAGGKPTPKKDLALMAMTYGNVYVARSRWAPTTRRRCEAFREAEAYDGPSLIIAYSHCIAHGFDLGHGMDQQKAAVAVGLLAAVPLQPAARAGGQESAAARLQGAERPAEEYAYNETRYTMLAQSDPDEARRAARRSRRTTSPPAGDSTNSSPPCRAWPEA